MRDHGRECMWRSQYESRYFIDGDSVDVDNGFFSANSSLVCIDQGHNLPYCGVPESNYASVFSLCLSNAPHIPRRQCTPPSPLVGGGARAKAVEIKRADRWTFEFHSSHPSQHPSHPNL